MPQFYILLFIMSVTSLSLEHFQFTLNPLMPASSFAFLHTLGRYPSYFTSPRGVIITITRCCPVRVNTRQFFFSASFFYPTTAPYPNCPSARCDATRHPSSIALVGIRDGHGWGSNHLAMPSRWQSGKFEFKMFRLAKSTLSPRAR